MADHHHEIEVPAYYVCPISLEIMRDPVTIVTGITYDRDSIETWIFTQHNTTCPVTNLPLSPDAADLVTPNVTLRRLIQSWCTLHALDRLPTPKPPVTKPQLLKILSQSPLQSLQSLKPIAASNQTNKRCMENAGVPAFLASLIVTLSLRPEPESKKASEEALSILSNLHLSDSGLNALTLIPDFLDSLTHLMHHSNYAVTMLKSMLEAADHQISLKPEFFAELAQILTVEHGVCRTASKATLKLLVTVCPWGRNRAKAVEAGFVHLLINHLLDDSCDDKRACEMMLTVLDMLCQCADGRAELIRHAAGLAVVSKKVLRVSNVASERAVRILHSVSRFSAGPGVLQEMMQTGVVAKLCLVVQVDCGLKTKERAREILKLHGRAWRNSACLPTSLISSYPSP